jgi:hypothetical protein
LSDVSKRAAQPAAAKNREGTVARTGQIWVGAAVVAASAALAATSSHANADTRVRKDREIVETAAGRLSYQAINDAWIQTILANPAPLSAITGTVPLRYVGAHEQAGSVRILTFAAHRATCIDLISSPLANTVRTRQGC